MAPAANPVVSASSSGSATRRHSIGWQHSSKPASGVPQSVHCVICQLIATRTTPYVLVHVVPAGGQSRINGRDKALLRWLRGTTTGVTPPPAAWRLDGAYREAMQLAQQPPAIPAAAAAAAAAPATADSAVVVVPLAMHPPVDITCLRLVVPWLSVLPLCLPFRPRRVGSGSNVGILACFCRCAVKSIGK